MKTISRSAPLRLRDRAWLPAAATAAALAPLPLLVRNPPALIASAALAVAAGLLLARRSGRGMDGVLALLSAVLLAASMPGFGVRPLALVALVPLMAAARRATSWKSALASGSASGVALIWIAMPWGGRAFMNYSDVPAVTGQLMYLPFAVLLGYKMALFAVVVSANERRRFCTPLLLAPLTFAALETASLDAYPWFIGLSQTGGYLAQLADLGGLPLVTFAVVLINAAVAECIAAAKVRNRRRFAAFAALALGVVSTGSLYGALWISRVNEAERAAPTLAVAVIQPDSPSKVLRADAVVRQDICATLETLAAQAARKLRPDLTVFAEGAAPMGYQIRFNPEFCDAYAAVAGKTGAPVLADNNRIERQPDGSVKMWRGALLIAPDGSVAGEYLKRRLVMFGETMPFSKLLPSLRKLFPFTRAYEAGTDLPELTVAGMRIAPQICFEAIHPGLVREYAARDVGLLVNLVNDVWYASPLQARQHLALSLSRCIENRMPMVRAANTGVSAYVNAAGEPWGETFPVDMPWSDSRAVPIPRLNSFYRSFGNVFGWACVAALFLLAARGSLRRKSPV